MRSDRAEHSEGAGPRGWRARIAEVSEAGGSLLATRFEILREELGGKTSFLGKGLFAMGLCFALGIGALLLFAALLVAVFAGLLKSVALGILAALLLYGAAAAVFARLGWNALSKVAPFDFPATREEIARDWAAVREAACDAEEAPEAGTESSGEDAGSVEDIEERFRAGAE